MHGQAADQQVASLGGLRNRVAVRVDLQQFAFADECVQTVGQFAAASPFTPSSRNSCLWLADLLGLAGDVAKDGGIGEHLDKVSGIRSSGLWEHIAIPEF